MTQPRAYYNEINPAACAVLRELIARDVIAPGDVDDRSIKDVQPDDLRGYTQAHFFAGGGLWSVAARLAGWPDDRPLWTGSCPCQPYSAAGKGLGADDPRHLWPDFYRLIRARRPAVVMGEQTSGAAGYGWFDGVGASMAGEDYAGRAVDIPVCTIDSPHQRNRLYWIFQLQSYAQKQFGRPGLCEAAAEQHRLVTADGDGELQSDAHSRGCDGRPQVAQRQAEQRTVAQRPLLRNGSWWADAEWYVSSLDNKARRAKPGIRFLVDGLPGRVDLWGIGGNAINPIIGAEVITAFLETESAEASMTVIGEDRV